MRRPAAAGRHPARLTPTLAHLICILLQVPALLFRHANCCPFPSNGTAARPEHAGKTAATRQVPFIFIDGAISFPFSLLPEPERDNRAEPRGGDRNWRGWVSHKRVGLAREDKERRVMEWKRRIDHKLQLTDCNPLPFARRGESRKARRDRASASWAIYDLREWTEEEQGAERADIETSS